MSKCPVNFHKYLYCAPLSIVRFDHHHHDLHHVIIAAMCMQIAIPLFKYVYMILMLHVLAILNHCACFPLVSSSCLFYNTSAAAEVTISNLTLASRTATTLSVTWSAGYPKCYTFTVSHSTQDGSINVTQPADSDTSHTLTSLQPGTTYRIEVEAVRKGDGADGQRAKVMGNFTTESEGCC